MKSNRIFSTSLALMTFGFLAANSAYATTWTVTQLTNNPYTDHNAQIDGSNVVWYGSDGNDNEIFLYDGESIMTTQLTDNNYDDRTPQIDGPNVVWEGFDGNDYEIFLATPEPATLTLLLIAGLTLIKRKRK